jgi:hypothetical protein
MEPIGDHAMKIRWTFPIVAAALVVGAFPAFASQGAPTSRQITERKLDAAARTPYVTKHQAANLNKVSGMAEGRVADEPIAYSQAPGQAPGPTNPSANSPQGQQTPTTQQTEAQQTAPEPEKPKYRFMGTACGYGDDVAMFDNGGATPVFRRVGDRIEDGSEIVAIERGCVSLVQEIPAAKKGERATTKRFDLYNW